MSVSDERVNARKKTLLHKYDLVVDCLSFEHIEKCNNIKELEKILKILRSGEEGHYPHLEKAAEEKLRKLSPNSHLLRIESPVIPTSALGPLEKQVVSNDMQKWAQEMSSRENLLKSQDSLNPEDTPAIRDFCVSKAVNVKNKMSKSSSPQPKEKSTRKCAPNNYTFWDKFDADSEVLKLDMEEERLADKKAVERKQQEEQQRRKEKQKLEEDNAIHKRLRDMRKTTGAGDELSLPEKEFSSLQEKVKGNEYFRNQDLLKALEHYTCSISFLPNVDAYNNRAQTYLKLKDYSSAVEDCKSVLSMDPTNVKAYYRRGSALFSLEKYEDALDDFEKALEIDPSDKSIQDSVKNTRSKLGIPVSSKRIRVPIQTKNSTSVLVEEMGNSDSHDKYYPFFNTNPNEDIALNAIGTAKVMCRCNGTPGFMKKVRSLDDIKDHGRLCLRRNSRPRVVQTVHTESDAKEVDTNMESVRLNSKEEDSDNMLMDELSPNFSSLVSPRSSANNKALSKLEKTKTPSNFAVFWSSIKGVHDLPIVAKALRVLSPEVVVEVVGPQLNGKMLRLFVMALRAHFSLPDEWGVVQRYLQCFTKSPNLELVKTVLDHGTRKELELLLNDAERMGLRVSDLLELYGLTA